MGLKMTDEEILKRIAEIEFPYRNERHFTIHDKLGPCIWEYDPDIDHTYTPWNPLTNWSDLGPLIEKYQIGTVKMGNGNWSVAVWQENIVVEHCIHESLPHAICLAIIGADE